MNRRLRLRPYKPCDADAIISWCKDEVAFRKWSSDRWPHYPLTAEEFNDKYINNNGDCHEADNFYPMTAYDDTGIVGHLILRFTDGMEKRNIRFGFVIVDESKRGLGYGKEMISLAIKYSFEILGVSRITLGVFDNNPSAYYCYKSAGFKEYEPDRDYSYTYNGEKWKCIEMEIKREDYEITH